MPKMATKAADNVFYKARIAAASWNDRLGSREGASEVTGIDRTRLANLELGIIDIAADGVIDAKEKPRMEQYLEVLDEITNKAQTLKLIYRKQFGKQEV